jgi:hypothetical protein
LFVETLNRYLMNLTNWRRPSDPKGAGPIFLYAGNEGPIELFAKNTGFMWEIAPEYGAALIFIEHRYYGSTHFIHSLQPICLLLSICRLVGVS